MRLTEDESDIAFDDAVEDLAVMIRNENKRWDNFIRDEITW